jgi:hypothetical protein
MLAGEKMRHAERSTSISLVPDVPSKLILVRKSATELAKDGM